jgi:hypothetical protein
MTKRKIQSGKLDSQYLSLLRVEVEDLVTLSRYYEKSMGLSRHLVRIASGSVMRARFRFVSDESQILEKFASSVRNDMKEKGEEERPVPFTPRALVAFWGRALSSLDSQRSRRKMSDDQIRIREELTAKLQQAVAALYKKSRGAMEREIETRRATEAVWMRERLAG